MSTSRMLLLSGLSQIVTLTLDLLPLCSSFFLLGLAPYEQRKQRRQSWNSWQTASRIGFRFVKEECTLNPNHFHHICRTLLTVAWLYIFARDIKYFTVITLVYFPTSLWSNTCSSLCREYKSKLSFLCSKVLLSATIALASASDAC